MHKCVCMCYIVCKCCVYDMGKSCVCMMLVYVVNVCGCAMMCVHTLWVYACVYNVCVCGACV